MISTVAAPAPANWSMSALPGLPTSQARARPPYAGTPVSIKDLFDIKGRVTRAGSRALDDSPPAEADAPVVARLRRAGFIVIGPAHTNAVGFFGRGLNAPLR